MTTKNVVVFLLLSFALSFGGCALKSTKKTTDTPETVSTLTPEEIGSSPESFEVNADSDSGKAGTLKTIYFDFNSANLRDDASAALKENAEFLKLNSAVTVQIEGHCDERGSVQYNLALSEKRAKSVKKFLSALGIKSKRLATVPYGKERPLAFGHEEDSWSKNRRANFVITAK